MPEDGNWLLTFRYANGGAADRPMQLGLGGSADTWQVSFPTTSGWTNWNTSNVTVPLTKGTQTVTLTSLTADGGPNLDDLTLTKSDSAADPVYVQPVIKEGAIQVEKLSCGLIAANTGNGMFLSWRALATDAAGTSFKLYKKGNLLKEISAADATNYLDAGGKATDTYGRIRASGACWTEAVLTNTARAES